MLASHEKCEASLPHKGKELLASLIRAFSVIHEEEAISKDLICLQGKKCGYQTKTKCSNNVFCQQSTVLFAQSFPFPCHGPLSHEVKPHLCHYLLFRGQFPPNFFRSPSFALAMTTLLTSCNYGPENSKSCPCFFFFRMSNGAGKKCRRLHR